MIADLATPADAAVTDEQIDYQWERFPGDHRAFARAVLRLAEIGNIRAAVRFRNGNTALIDALMNMVWQFVGEDDPDAAFSHQFISAEECALETLVDAGFAEQTKPGANSYRLLWAKLAERKAAARTPQMTWEEAVDLCVTDADERARILALGVDSEGGTPE
jgi:hypothetical protein